MKNVDLIEMLNMDAMGGTELMVRRLYERLPRELLKQVQIIPTRLTGELDPTRIRIAYVHDLPGDPSLDYLKNGGWNRFHRLVFVSNWQLQQFIGYYQIPWSKCVVIQNGIPTIPDHKKPIDKIKLIYTPTPHRGLSILAAVFDKLSQEHDNIELDIYSSFDLYKWPERDDDFKPLFDFMRNHPKINYHQTVTNDVIREALTQAHIFAYPSVWNETSCLCLIEAMAAGLLCVHPNYGALYETAANLTYMYQYQEDPTVHAGVFHNMLNMAIKELSEPHVEKCLAVQKSYARSFYDIDVIAKRWLFLLQSLVGEPREMQSNNVEIFKTETSLPRF